MSAFHKRLFTEAFLGKILKVTWLLNSDVGQLRRQQATQRLVETATATNKNANTVVKYYQGHGFLLKT